MMNIEALRRKARKQGLFIRKSASAEGLLPLW